MSVPALRVCRALRAHEAVLLLPSDPCTCGVAEQLFPLGGVAPLAVCACLQHCFAEPAHEAGHSQGKGKAG